MTVLNEVWLQLLVMKMGGPSQKMPRVEIGVYVPICHSSDTRSIMQEEMYRMQ